MNKHQSSGFGLNSLWKINGHKRYSIKKFINSGTTHIVFKDQYRDRDVIGKVVETFSEGEVYHWPRLHHRSLAPLLDVVSINNNATIFISTFKDISLREIVHDEDFANSPRCFANKKIYIQDILWGLNYLHRNSLVLMNISDSNVYICLESNKAVITDFGCLKSICQAKKFTFPFPPFYQAPEISKSNNGQYNFHAFYPIAAEMWAFGVMALEVFLQHRVPWVQVDYICSRATEILNYIDLDTLKTANRGSVVMHEDLVSFKEFVNLFLSGDPYNRSDARHAALSMFLKPSKHNIADKTSKNCSQQRHKNTKKKATGNNNSIRLNDELSTKSSQEISNPYSQQVVHCIEGNIRGNSAVGLNDLSRTKSSQTILETCSHQINERVEGKETEYTPVVLNDFPPTKDSNILPVSKHRVTLKFSKEQLKNSIERIYFNSGLSAKTSREHLPLAQSYSMYESTCRIEVAPSIRKVQSLSYPTRKSSLRKQNGKNQETSENLSDEKSLNLVSKNIQQESSLSDLEFKTSNKIRKSELNLDLSTRENFSPLRREKNKEIRTFESSFLNLNKETKHHSGKAFENKTLSQNRLNCSRSKSMYIKRSKQDLCRSYISLRNLNSSKRTSNNMKLIKEAADLIQRDPVLRDFRNSSVIQKSYISSSTLNIQPKKPKRHSQCFIQNENVQTEVHSSRYPFSDEDIQCQKSVQKTLVCQTQPLELIGKRKRLLETNMVKSSSCILRNRFHCPIHSKIESYNSFQHDRKLDDQNFFSVDQSEKSKKYRSLHLFKPGPLSNCYYSQINADCHPSNSRDDFLGNNEIVSFGTENLKYSRRHSYKRAIYGDGNFSALTLIDGFTSKRLPNVDKKYKMKLLKRGFIRVKVVSQKHCPEHTSNMHGYNRIDTDTVNRKLKKEKTLKNCFKQRKAKLYTVIPDEKKSLSSNAKETISQHTLTSSLTVLTAETINKPAVLTANDKPKDKRKSIKKSALYLLCLGDK